MNPLAISSILAPTDLSASSVPALRYARLFADRYRARLTVVYAEPIVFPTEFGGAEAIYSLTPEHEAELRTEVEKHAGPAMEGRAFDVDITLGHPIAAILTASRRREADLIVMGTHLRHGWRRALLGSISEGVLHGSDCPVLTVASGDAWTGATPYAVTHVLCPVNFSDVARDSVRMAALLCDAFGARLTLVHVLQPDAVVRFEDAEAEVRAWIGPDLQDVCSYRNLVVRGGPAERVLDCAEDVGADLVVVGAQHKLFRDATVIGTTSERIVRFASCPVLVVPRKVASREQDVEAHEPVTAASAH
jgi:nucleotide-binding universal stress UspA family protein